jgi:hypothetical protein
MYLGNQVKEEEESVEASSINLFDALRKNGPLHLAQTTLATYVY